MSRLYDEHIAEIARKEEAVLEMPGRLEEALGQLIDLGDRIEGANQAVEELQGNINAANSAISRLKGHVLGGFIGALIGIFLARLLPWLWTSVVALLG